MKDQSFRRSLASALQLAVLCAAGLGRGRPPDRDPVPHGRPVPSLSPSTAHQPQVVLITDNAVNPRLVTLDEGQLVAWISTRRFRP
jgi:hypothetical protein